jgi:hypothetical protein
MTDSTNTPDEVAEAGAPKKITLEEAIKRKLAQKKEQQSGNKQTNQHSTSVQAMKHQQTKKSNNQKRRTGV